MGASQSIEQIFDNKDTNAILTRINLSCNNEKNVYLFGAIIEINRTIYNLNFIKNNNNYELNSITNDMNNFEIKGYFAGPVLEAKFNACKSQEGYTLTKLNESAPINQFVIKNVPVGGSTTKLRYNSYEKRSLAQLRTLAKDRKIINYGRRYE